MGILRKITEFGIGFGTGFVGGLHDPLGALRYAFGGDDPPRCGLRGCGEPAAEISNCCDLPLCAAHAHGYKSDRRALGHCPVPGCGR